MTTNPLAHILYRVYDASGQLLYIGITSNLVNRLRAHQIEKPWWAEVDTTRTLTEDYNSRVELAEAERRAIVTEKPRHNKTFNGPVSHIYSLAEVAMDCLPPEWVDGERWLMRRLRTGELRGHKVDRTWVMTEKDVQFMLRLYSNADKVAEYQRQVREREPAPEISPSGLDCPCGCTVRVLTDKTAVLCQQRRDVMWAGLSRRSRARLRPRTY